MFFYNLPEAAIVGIAGYAFKHDCCGTIRQRTVNNITVTGDPADVCRTPVHIVFPVLKYIFKGKRRVYHIPGGGMYHSFGRSG